ncbi:hypothetical protein B834_1768 [Enterococcus mundtii 1A]|uniref:hypothetical protein n=1 Tax=Enterococcus TaxID=1350 RepID=UPI000445A268|nr:MULTISPECIES: hypothetical protein [Enterococcus]AZP93881.1 hypothetical protein CYK55_12885 [Enterococcus mundtii]EYT95950.1 hypothetical protein AK89_06085 [Enterococcus mundtii CRL35]MDA9429273.1 hypothetical protein [Enterococcus mundtii 1A]MDO7880094.1 hypothetical protein [Enterococcus mundtii]
MPKIASQESTATAVVSGIKNVSVSSSKPSSLSKSTISSMKTGVEVSNKLLNDISILVTCVNEQANKFPQLAQAIAVRDSQTRFK